MTILVTGASGFLGCTLVEQLAGAGETVLATDVIDPPPGFVTHVRGLPGRVTFASMDITEPAEIAACLADATIRHVVHGATITAGPERDRSAPTRTIDVNLAGTANLLHALAERPPERFVHVSSGAAYGATATAVDLLTEDMTGEPRSIYEITKLASERVAARLGDLCGMDVRIARLSTVFGVWERATGARDTMSPMLQLVLAARRGDNAVLPRPIVRDWIYSRDAAAGLVAIARMTDAAAPRIFNVGPGPDRAWSVLDWGKKLEDWFPDFRCRLAEPGEAATPKLDQAHDRAPFSIERILAHTDYRPRFMLDAAFADYRRWCAGTGAGQSSAAAASDSANGR